MKQKLIFIILISFSKIILAQEYTTTTAYISSNNVFFDKSIDTISLPLFSDFSETEPLKYYETSTISIATFEAILPPSVYSAMFDATDNNGDFYATSYNQSLIADNLTSKPIDLFFPGDTTIYFSFYYEPKGLLDTPEDNDSLVLQFFAPNQNKWYNVWFATNYTNVQFEQVKFKISDTAFLQKGFKFRFYNKISMPTNTHPSFVSNCDYWFVDYIYLNKNRSFNDNSKRDIAFQYPAVLKIDDYNNVPYSHYKEIYTTVNHNIKLNFRNNDDNIREVDSMYIVFKDKNDIFENDTLYIGSYALVGNNNSNLFRENISFSYPINNEEFIDFEMNTKLITDTYDSTSNNIIIQNKKLSTTYSYDDGTSENGYGLYGDGTLFSYVAQQYYTYKTDELSGIKAYFNKTFKFQQPYYFYTVVWDNNNGKPGNIIYEQDGFEINHDNLNNFQYFEFNQTVTVSDTFYIGWMKTTSELMNIGLDLNFNGTNKKFYSIYNGVWDASTVNGTIMMQPVFGDINLAKVDDLNTDLSMRIYPNPAYDILNIQMQEKNSESENLFIFDISGRLILSKKFNNSTSININSLSQGFYILKINSGDKTYTQKIIKR